MSLTATHGKNGYVECRLGSSGNYTDISNKCSNAQVAFNRDVAETSTFGQGDKTYVGGLRDQTISFDFYTDDALRTILFAAYLSDTPLTIRLGPDGNSTGKERLSANFFITQFSDGGGIGSVVGGQASAQRTGATTVDAW